MAKKKGLFTILKRIFISEAHSDKVIEKEKISIFLLVKVSRLLVSLLLCIYAEREEKKMDILETQS